MEIFGPVKCWPISSEPITLPFCSIRLPPAWCGKIAVAKRREAQGIEQAR